MGDITVGLYGDDTPNTVANFKQYVTDEFYDGLIFHRVIPGFVAQGGGYDEDLVARKTREDIDFEASPLIKHVKYVISMARSSVHSATSQFFIMLGDAPHLDFESEDDFFDDTKFPCTAFGEVIEGFDVVDAIGETETGTSGMFEDVPVEPIVIDSAILVN
jgi:cyclophilin family peptidyl-prolyl cis-trans isomerase